MGPITADTFSTAALGLPGRFTTSVRPTMPATSRERQAFGVIASDAARMASGMPGAMRSHTAAVASGVTSRGENPVPPVVSTSATPRAAASRSSASIRSRSSGTRRVATTRYPWRSASSTSAGPLASGRSPLNERSLTVMTSTEKGSPPWPAPLRHAASALAAPPAPAAPAPPSESSAAPPSSASSNSTVLAAPMSA